MTRTNTLTLGKYLKLVQKKLYIYIYIYIYMRDREREIER